MLENNTGEPITITTIVDIMNLIGKCVVAGNVRRTAEIVFGDPNSEEYLDLKNYKVNHRDQIWLDIKQFNILSSWVWTTQRLRKELMIMEKPQILSG